MKGQPNIFQFYAVEPTRPNKAIDKGSILAKPAVIRIASDGMGMTLDSKIIRIRTP